MSTSVAIRKILIQTIPFLIEGLREIIPLVRKRVKGKKEAEKIEQVLTHLSSSMEEVKNFSEEQEKINKKLRKMIFLLAILQMITLIIGGTALYIVIIQ